ncbi:MAG TPA: hypothetical protein VFT13_08070, partial [Candidatus Krumholzibacteria bacterium]|nr:hypothetical protein [Candidatus Krumholzibacteria bacterium]
MKRNTAVAISILLVAGAILAPSAGARETPARESLPRANEYLAPGISDRSPALPPFAPASATTTVLYYETFGDGGTCDPAGWTSLDLTAQIGTFFHIDDYAGLPFGPVQGTKSLWCGARESNDPALCRYATLPGYGNSWDQLWVTKECISVNGDLEASFLMRLDTEASYDAVTLEYTTDCSGVTGWTILDGGINVWDGTQSLSINQSYSVGGATNVRVGIRFTSDVAWSDEDGLQDTNGAVHIDNLSVEASPVEDFEDEASGATSSNLWIAASPPGYGTAAALVLGATMLQDKDNCTRNIGCMWAFIEGSTATYGCGSQPQQTAVPFGNDSGQYLLNNILSPYIPISGAGDGWNLEFSLYSDLPLDNLVFWVWHVRSIDASGCPSRWADREFIGGYGVHGWREMVLPFGDLLNFTTATHVQVALGAWDLCGLWCGTVGSGACHTHSPLFDNVRVYRVDLQGPQWSIRSMDQFQDAFPSDGTLTGVVRADMANDVTPAANLNSIIPGDSATLRVLDLSNGLGIDPVAGGAAVYGYVSVWPQGQADKSGDHLTQDPGRWPVVGSWVDAGGVSWTCLRLDSSIVNGTPQPDIYCLDLNDNLFEPGDTVCFFYAAKNANGVETVAFGSNLALRSDDRNEAAADPSEFTCLPAGGYNRGGDVLYVDGADGSGAQAHWELAFRSLDLLDKVDRYDVRQPSGVSVSNRLEGRVANVTQLLIPYRKILWDCADLSKTLGDGSANFEKTDDWGLLNSFLA